MHKRGKGLLRSFNTVTGCFTTYRKGMHRSRIVDHPGLFKYPRTPAFNTKPVRDRSSLLDKMSSGMHRSGCVDHPGILNTPTTCLEHQNSQQQVFSSGEIATNMHSEGLVSVPCPCKDSRSLTWTPISQQHGVSACHKVPG